MSAIESVTGLKDGICEVTCRSILDDSIRTRNIRVDFEKLMHYAMRPEGCIQEVFPELSDDDREFIHSGICPDEWDDLLGDED